MSLHFKFKILTCNNNDSVLNCNAAGGRAGEGKGGGGGVRLI